MTNQKLLYISLQENGVHNGNDEVNESEPIIEELKKEVNIYCLIDLHPFVLNHKNTFSGQSFR